VRIVDKTAFVGECKVHGRDKVLLHEKGSYGMVPPPPCHGDTYGRAGGSELSQMAAVMARYVTTLL
jgi:hypothetical protein